MSIQVYNLSPYTTYQLRLIAENVVGRSAPSSPTRGFVTLKAVPEVAPRNVTAIASNATAFTISWLVSHINPLYTYGFPSSGLIQ